MFIKSILKGINTNNLSLVHKALVRTKTARKCFKQLLNAISTTDAMIKSKNGKERRRNGEGKGGTEAAFPLRKYFKESLTPGVYNLRVSQKSCQSH